MGFIRNLVLNIRELFRFYRDGPVDVIFYSPIHMDEIWLRSTISECERRGLSIAVVYYGHSQFHELPRFSRTYFGTGLFTRFSKCRIVITASSSIKRSFLPLGMKHLIYMPHTFSSLHTIYPENSFDDYTALMAAGEHHVAEFEKMNELAGYHRPSFRVGYGKMDFLLSESKKKTKTENRKKQVVIAPSWVKQNILDTLGVELIQNLLLRGYKVIVRPHPLFFKERKQLIAQMEETFRDQADFELERSDRTSESIFSSDLLIGDFSGVSVEFAFLRLKPVLFIDMPPKILNSKWKEFGITPFEVEIRENLGMVANPDLNEICMKVEALLNSTTSLKDSIEVARNKYCFNFGRVGVAATEVIQQLLKD